LIGLLVLLSLSLICVVLGFSTKTTRDADRSWILGAGAGGGRGQKNRKRESRGGEDDDDRGGRATADGRTDGGDAADGIRVRGSGGLSSSGGEVLCRECGATKTNNSQRERERESAPERRQHKQTGRTGNYYIPAAAAVDIAIEECDVGIVVVVCLCCVRFFDKDNERRGSIMDFGAGAGGGRGQKKSRTSITRREDG
jgi:hypothetical protein